MAQTIFKSGIGEKLRNLILLQPSFEEQYCRFCLSTGHNQWKDLFSPLNPTQSIAEVIQDFAKVIISQGDEYSKLICLACFTKLIETENFKDVIVNSDFKLRNQQKTICKDPLETDPALNNDGIDEKFVVDEVDIKKEVEQDENSEDIKIEENDSLAETENKNCKVPQKVKRKYFRKPLKCSECGEVCRWYNDLKKHMITHTGIYPFYCSFCNKGFTRKYDQEIHEVNHTGETKYQCEICGKSSKRYSAFKLHKKTHQDLVPFKCDLCNKTFKSKHNFVLHMASKHPIKTDESSFNCDICKKRYQTKFHLQNHMRQIHKPSKFGTCNICGKAVQHLTAHQKSHLKQYKCPVCDKYFSTIPALKTHSAVHSKEKLYECDICKNRFSFKQSLLRHRKTHDLNNWFKCEFCDKQFLYQHYWKIHLKKIHHKNNN